MTITANGGELWWLRFNILWRVLVLEVVTIAIVVRISLIWKENGVQKHGNASDSPSTQIPDISIGLGNGSGFALVIFTDISGVVDYQTWHQDVTGTVNTCLSKSELQQLEKR